MGREARVEKERTSKVTKRTMIISAESRVAHDRLLEKAQKAGLVIPVLGDIVTLK